MADFDDPFTPTDATIVRPRPGGGKRRPAVAPPARPAAPRVPEPEPAPAAAVRVGGLNPLVAAASPLLLLAGQLRGTASAPDVAALKRHALDEIRRFEARALEDGVAREVVLAARYTLCACLDEAVLSTPWGGHSEWGQQTLLVALHREAWGGEKFFDMLDRIAREPARHLDLMELQYVCITLGFAGKYQVRDRGDQKLAEVQRAVYQKIREQRGAPAPELSLRWQGVQDRRNPLIRYVPWWVVGAASLVLLAGLYTTYAWRLSATAAPVKQTLAGIRTSEGPAPPAVPVAGPTLRERLSGDPALVVSEDGGRTTIRVAVPDLFASASAVVGESHRALLGRVAQAIEAVPGSVRVIGHTDDQPLRSPRFSDNFELSQARARSVADLLLLEITDRSRVSSDGVGALRPLPEDPSLSAAGNRARNRRVEIVHEQGR